MAEMSDPTSAIALSLSSLKRDGITLSEQQVAAILSVVNGKDTVVCLPTGHGKSVIFEVVPWCHEMLVKGLGEEDKEAVFSVLIVSPLVSLMEKQVDGLVQRGQSAVRLWGELPGEMEEAVFSGRVRYIFGSPECLEEKKWREMLLLPVYQTRLKAVFIDEAHCVDMWGGGWKSPFSSIIPETRRPSVFFAQQCPICSPNCYSCEEYSKGHNRIFGFT